MRILVAKFPLGYEGWEKIQRGDVITQSINDYETKYFSNTTVFYIAKWLTYRLKVDDFRGAGICWHPHALPYVGALTLFNALAMIDLNLISFD